MNNSKRAVRRKLLRAISLTGPAILLPARGLRGETLDASFRPEDFGAVGNAINDDTFALAKCFDAAGAIVRKGGNATIVLANVYAVAATTSIRNINGNLSLIGTQPGAGFKAVGTDDVICVHLSGGRQVGLTWTAELKASRGDRFVPVGSLSGLVPRQNLLLSQPTGYAKDVQRYLNRVVDVSDNGIELEFPLPNDIPGQFSTRFDVIDITGSVKIKNLTFDGTGNSGNSTGLKADFLRAPVVTHVTSRGFDQERGEGQSYLYCYRGSFSGLRDQRSGRSGSTNSIKFYVISNSRIYDVQVQNSKGFAIGLTHCSYCKVKDIASIGAAGRGIKLFSSSANEFSGVRVIDSGKTGLSVTGGSSYNRFEAIETKHNKQAGLWLNGTGNNFNRFMGVQSAQNGTDIQVAATPPLLDQGNLFSEVSRDAKRLAIDPRTRTELRWQR